MNDDAHEPTRVIVAADAEGRIERARAFARAHAASGRRVVVVAPRIDRARAFVADLAVELGVVVDVEATTLDRLAARLARPWLTARGLAIASGLATEAAAGQALVELAPTLPRMGALVRAPGMPRAIAKTLRDLELADVSASSVSAVDPELARLAAAVTRRLSVENLVSRARVLEQAREALVAAEEEDRAVVLLDVPLRARLETELALAILDRSRASLATVHATDRGTIARLAGRAAEVPTTPTRTAALARALFSESDGSFEDVLTTTLARGEAAEAAEVARTVLCEARAGTPLHRIAIVLRRPETGRAVLETALSAAGIPYAFSRGARRPDPTGRAFLALVTCAAEGLSVRSFSAYLSYGVLPDSAGGAPPEAWQPGDRFVDEESESESDGDEPAEADLLLDREGVARTVRGGALRAPRRWESLLVEAAVVGGGAERWTRRIAGLREELARRAHELARLGKESGGVVRELDELDAMSRFALPLIAELAALPREAPLATYREALAALATRALAEPERVLAVLLELAPIARVDAPITLPDLVRVLAARLSSVEVGRSKTGVAVLAPDELRGTTFDVVLVPGLAERTFPLRVSGDPLLPDDARAEISADLVGEYGRAQEERLLFALVVGAATKRIFASASIVGDAGRRRVPSVYFVELLGRALGRLPTRRDLAHATEHAVRSVESAERAARASERDLAIVRALIARPEDEARGRARYLVAHRAVHAAVARRFRRGKPRLSAADGLVESKRRTIEALAPHRIGARPYSATALEALAACPYRFFLRAILHLSPQATSEPLAELDPMLRGSIFHESQYRVLGLLRDRGLLPLDATRLEEARALLEADFAQLRIELVDRLVPSIPRVFDDELDALLGDLREWLARVASDREWTPTYFELAMGSPPGEAHDPASRAEPARLANGVLLRGAIDVVERRTEDARALRATDHKTGSTYALDRARTPVVVRGGKTLQPVLYALALEALFPDAHVEGGRLYYCTPKGRHRSHHVPLDGAAREGAAAVVATLENLLSIGLLPAVPEGDACGFCDYAIVCGPHAAARAAQISPEPALDALVALRRRA